MSFPSNACSNPPSSISLAPSHSPPTCTPPEASSPSIFVELLAVIVESEIVIGTISSSVRSIIIEVEKEVEEEVVEEVATVMSEDLLLSLFRALEGRADRRREGGTGLESMLSVGLAVQATRSLRSDANKQYGMPDRMLLVVDVFDPVAFISSTVRGEEDGGTGGKKVSTNDSGTLAEEDADVAASAPAPSFSFFFLVPLEFTSLLLILN